MGSVTSIATAATAANPPAATRGVWFKRIGPPWLWGVAARPLMARVCTALLGGPCGDESLPKTPPSQLTTPTSPPQGGRAGDRPCRLPSGTRPPPWAGCLAGICTPPQPGGPLGQRTANLHATARHNGTARRHCVTERHQRHRETARHHGTARHCPPSALGTTSVTKHDVAPHVFERGREPPPSRKVTWAQ